MLLVNTVSLLASGGTIGGYSAQQGAITAAAMPFVSGIVPSGVDEISVLAATAFTGEGLDFDLTSAEGTAILAAASEGLLAVGNAYQAADAAGASIVL
jgi:hypothetical protein